MKVPRHLPSRAAREFAGLTPAAAAKRARVTPRYLLACERTQNFPLILAERLVEIYGDGTNLNDFLRFTSVASGSAGRRMGESGAGAGRSARSRRARRSFVGRETA